MRKCSKNADNSRVSLAVRKDFQLLFNEHENKILIIQENHLFSTGTMVYLARASLSQAVDPGLVPMTSYTTDFINDIHSLPA